MFESVLIDVRRAASGLVVSYLGRAVVAIPFILAAGFGIAALTLMLIEHYGAQMAYWLLAGGFMLIGIVGAIIVNAKEQEAEQPIIDDQQKRDESNSGPLAMAESAIVPAAAALIPLLTSPLGVGGTMKVGRWALRNIPLLLLAALLAILLWPTGRSAVEEVAAADGSAARHPNAPAPAE